MNKVKVKINGKDIELQNVSNLEEMLNDRNIKGMFVVEKNMEIVPREHYSRTQVSEDDNFEIVGLFGGG